MYFEQPDGGKLMDLQRQSDSESRQGSRKEMAKMIELLEKLGPNIDLIARTSGQFKETVRYRYNEKIVKRFGLQARVNHERLGLKRVVVIGRLNRLLRSSARQLFEILSESCYTVSYARTIPDGKVVISFSIPEEFFGNLERLMRELRRARLFRTDKILKFDWIRTAPMRAEFYDFDADKWELDWQLSERWAEEALRYAPSTVGEFDYSDLLLVKELQVDATRSLTEIAAELRMGYRTALRHYAHVFDRRLISGYRALWIGSRYDPKRDVFGQLKHRYADLMMIVADTTSSEQEQLRRATNKVPFIWAEAGGKHLFAELVVPLEYLNEILRYLEQQFEIAGDRVMYYVGDQNDAIGFTIAYQLFDQRRKKWTFNSSRALTQLAKLQPSIQLAAPDFGRK